MWLLSGFFSGQTVGRKSGQGKSLKAQALGTYDPIVTISHRHTTGSRAKTELRDRADAGTDSTLSPSDSCSPDFLLLSPSLLPAFPPYPPDFNNNIQSTPSAHKQQNPGHRPAVILFSPPSLTRGSPPSDPSNRQDVFQLAAFVSYS